MKQIGSARHRQLRELRSTRFAISEHPLTVKFQLFFNRKVLPLLELDGYKVEQKHNLLAHMIHSLVVTRKRGGCVADSRDTAKPDVRLRCELWDLIVSKKLATKCLGSEASGKVTRYAATDALIKLRKEYSLEFLVDLNLKRNSELDRATAHGLVYLHTGKIDPATGEPLERSRQKLGIPFKHLSTPVGLEMVREIEDSVEAFNLNNVRGHCWEFYVTDPVTGRQHVSPLNPCLRQIHCGSWYRAVRFYSWSELSGQSLSKDERQTILIDGKPVTELDFSASQIRMLYHLRGLDPAGDLYRPERILPTAYKSKLTQERRDLLRDLVKRATLICLNVKSRKTAYQSIRHWLNEHPERSYLWTIIKDVEETNIKGVVSRIVLAHCDKSDEWRKWDGEKYRSKFGIGDLFFQTTGLQMMTEESKIMRQLMILFTQARKPALMIHDGLVCKVSDAKFARKAMISAYQLMLSTNFCPQIKTSF